MLNQPQKKFSKYSGAGNDFVLLDDRSQTFPYEDARFIARLCHRQKGIGSDGLILLRGSSKADFSMRIFNADGYEADMCGNGIRCLAMFLCRIGLGKKDYRIETKAGIYSVGYKGEDVIVEMLLPKEVRWNINLFLSGQSYSVHYVHTGVPHIVCFTQKLSTVDVESLGREMRYHQDFLPKGVNVNFVKLVEGKHRIRVRTYERGVEAETLACGTGATASAWAAKHQIGLKSPICVELKSGEELEISFREQGDKVRHLFMQGKASWIFDGFIPEFEAHSPFKPKLSLKTLNKS